MGTVRTALANEGSGRLPTFSDPALRKHPSSQPKQNKKVHAGKVIVVLLALASLTCSFGGLLPGATQANGPIVAMLPAPSVDEQGQPVNPTFTFDPSAPQIAVAIQLGQFSATQTLSVTWYQETNQGDQKLFSDSMQVNAFDRAYSIGKNPGKLAQGNYKIVAAMNGQSQQLEVTVTEPAQNQAQTQGQAATSTGAQSQTGQPPVSGGSGTEPSSSFAPPAASSSPSQNGASCALMMFHFGGAIDYHPPTVPAEAVFTGSCGKVEIQEYAVVNNMGSPQQIGNIQKYDLTGAILPGGSVSIGLDPIDPCSSQFPSPSDLPGTPVTISVKEINGRVAPSSITVRLSPDDYPPKVNAGFQSSSNSDKVKTGDKISVNFEASDFQGLRGHWQYGLEDIHITVNGKAVEGDKWIYGPPPKSCSGKKQDVRDSYTYTVLPSDTGELVVCVEAEDYDPNLTKYCHTYHTGKLWTGTVQATGANIGGSATYAGTLTLNEDAQGVLTGQGQVTLTSWHCTLHGNPAQAISFGMTGSDDGKQLKLQVVQPFNLIGGQINCAFGAGLAPLALDPTESSEYAVIPITGPGMAAGKWSATTFEYHINYQFNLTCQDCQPGVSMNASPMQILSAFSMPGFEAR